MAADVEILLADADVLIDYRDSDLSILKLVGEHIGPVRVLRETLDEAPGIAAARCTQLGITIVRLETDLMLEAGTLSKRLSFTDRLCVIACDHHGWTLVTNDGAMRTVCRSKGIRLRWGLGLMVDLVQAGALTGARALKVAGIIHQANPTHITDAILDRFRAALRKQ